ncbi:phage capsid protein [Reyranella sp.]|uniref:phage capsid protein n=1 Tax=Reyranella sp. TaxID=1929291 RepID=UPI003D0ED335
MLTDTDRISFQDKYRRDYMLLSQQMTARLVPYCDPEPEAIDARYFWFDFIGKTAPREKQGFGGPTPNMNPQHSRIRGNVVPYEWGGSFDEAQLRTLVSNPQAKHKMAAMAGFKRKQDSIIITAALGTRVSYNADGTTTDNALPAAQLIAHGSAGMTFDKVRGAKRLLDAAEVLENTPGGKYVMVYTAAQAWDLLAEAKATSRDYVGPAEILVAGEMTHWMGFDWVRSELLPVDGSSRRRCFAMATGGVGLFSELEPRVNIGRDPSSSFIERLMLDQNMGATRTEDVKVVEVPCVETAVT